MHLEERTLDLGKRPYDGAPVVLRRGENGETQIKANVTSSGTPYGLSGYTATLHVKFSDEKYLVESASISGSAVTYTVSDKLTNGRGVALAYFQLAKGGGDVTTQALPIIVAKDVDLTPEEAKEYQSAIDELVRQLGESIEKSDAAEAKRAEAEKARESAEATRESNEAARQTNEEARKAAEARRESNEAQREANEADRKAAESARVEAEAKRDSAEASRADAEGFRADAEIDRQIAEKQRAKDERTRQSNESGRVEAEEARQAAERQRSDLDAARSRAEFAREQAEATRQSNEADRQSAEEARAAADADREARQTANDAAQLKNDADQAHNNQIAKGFMFEFADAAADGRTPDVEEPKTGTLYIVRRDGSQPGDKHSEWLWTGEAWELWGDTNAVVTPITTEEVDTAMDAALTSDHALTAPGLSYLVGKLKAWVTGTAKAASAKVADTISGVLPIDRGGTGASTRGGAATALGFIGFNPVAIEEDTYAKWLSLGTGYAVFSEEGRLAGQPQKSGYLFSTVAGTNVSQVWLGWVDGRVFRRAGVVGDTAMREWHEVYTDASAVPTADRLATARKVNGVAFDGGSDITVYDSTKVAKSGDTMTGNLTLSGDVRSIRFKTSTRNREVITFTEGNADGSQLEIGTGGRIIIGAGESGCSESGNKISGVIGGSAGDENLYLGADGTVYVLSNCNTIANRKTFTFDTSGVLTSPSGFAGWTRVWTGSATSGTLTFSDSKGTVFLFEIGTDSDDIRWWVPAVRDMKNPIQVARMWCNGTGAFRSFILKGQLTGSKFVVSGNEVWSESAKLTGLNHIRGIYRIQ